MQLNYQPIRYAGLQRPNKRTLEGIDHAYRTLDQLGVLIAPTKLGISLREEDTPERIEGRLVFFGTARYFGGKGNERQIEVLVDGNTLSIRTPDNHQPSKKLVEGLAGLVNQKGSSIEFNGGHYELTLELNGRVGYGLKIPEGFLGC